MADKVKPLKLEDSTSGTEFNPSPTEVDPSEDYLAAKGIAFENLDTVFIDKSGSDMRFQDLVITSPLSLLQLRFHHAWQYAQDTTLTTTTSTVTYSTKVTFTTPSLESGDYWVGWSSKMFTSGANRSVQFEFRNGATVLETGQRFYPSVVATSHEGGMCVMTALSGVQTFDLRFRVGTAGSTTASCSSALIWIMRVS